MKPTRRRVVCECGHKDCEHGFIVAMGILTDQEECLECMCNEFEPIATKRRLRK